MDINKEFNKSDLDAFYARLEDVQLHNLIKARKQLVINTIEEADFYRLEIEGCDFIDIVAPVEVQNYINDKIFNRKWIRE